MIINRKIDIIDVQIFGLNKLDKEEALDIFEKIMQRTPSIVRTAEFDTYDFRRYSGTYFKIKLERIAKYPRLIQWKATFIAGDEIKMIAMGQI